MSRPIVCVAPVLLACVLAAPIASAAPRGEGHPGGPPQEAIDACSGLADASSCSFESPRGGVSGSCRTLPSVTVCVPDRPLAQGPGSGGPSGRPSDRGPGGRHQPPPAAFDACEGLTVGDACTVNTPHGKIDGTCGDHGDGAFCIPAGGPPDDRA